MKLAVVILLVLGVLAAGSAAVLVGALRGNGGPAEAPPEVEVLVAATSLPAASVLASSHVTEGSAPKQDLPEGYLTSPVQAIGKILAVPLVEGQILATSCFVSDGSGAQLAATLREGMRAFTVTVPGRAVSGGLLYPGCVVDVLAAFDLRSSERGEAISTTLLRGIQVLAVEDTTVVTKATSEKGRGDDSYRTSGMNLSVTLMVDSKQAEALQLVTQHGKISLAMRNPLDKKPVPTDATVLSQGRLAHMGSALDPVALAAQLEGVMLGDPNDVSSLRQKLDSSQDEGEASGRAVQTPTEAMGQLDQSPAQKRSSWLVTVIRGREVKDKELDVEE